MNTLMNTKQGSGGVGRWVMTAALAMLGAAVLAGCGPKGSDAAGGAGAGAGGEAGELAALGMAPEWTLKRLDGTTLKSAELAGKVVVVDFWATWCPPCVEEIPGYVEMQREHEAAGLVIVGISLDQAGVEAVRKFTERYAMNYPVVMNGGGVTEAFGGVEAIPTTFLIDREGRIRHRKVGMMTRAEYEPLVKALL